MRRGEPLVVVGDTLLDRDLVGAPERLSPDAPVPVLAEVEERSRPGGAGLAALLAASDGRPVTLVTALADDEPAEEVRRMLAAAGVEVLDTSFSGPAVTPEKVRVRTDADHALARLDIRCGAAPPAGPLPPEARSAIADAPAVLVSDYGRGFTAAADLRQALAGRTARHTTVWDPHPRGAEPVPGMRLVTPNRSEAGLDAGASLATVVEAARRLAGRWKATGVAVTLGGRGAVLVEGDGVLAVPAPSGAARGDACGAGDRFASAAAAALADGALPSEAVALAVQAASEFVAAGGASTLPHPQGGVAGHGHPSEPVDPFALVEAVRARGGTVVATGGCFDLVHAGHISLLRAARSLGDCLVVCLNSDSSVTRLKGPGRPVQTAVDRARVLSALDCVDAVAVFDEDTPEAVLERLRPDVFAKGADYTLASLPEAAVLARWGGQAVLLPYLEGRSTTRLIESVKR